MDARTVLLVDGDRDSRLMYGAILQHYGYGVLQADDGEEGFRLACTHHPDLIVVELAVSVWDGHRLTERLKQDSRTASIPVLVVTAWARAVDREVAEHDGCSGYLAKPCTPRRVLQEVRRFIGPPAGRLSDWRHGLRTRFRERHPH